MNLPYEGATTGDKAMIEIEKILRHFGCAKFGHGMDYDKAELSVQFEYKGRNVMVTASAKGYAAAWLKSKPYNNNYRYDRKGHEKKAMRQGQIAVYSILRDWIKGQVMAVETGILSFEGAFLGQIMLPSGQTVLDRITNDGMLKLENKAA